jgi:hypothetical protein
VGGLDLCKQKTAVICMYDRTGCTGAASMYDTGTDILQRCGSVTFCYGSGFADPYL